MPKPLYKCSNGNPEHLEFLLERVEVTLRVCGPDGPDAPGPWLDLGEARRVLATVLPGGPRPAERVYCLECMRQLAQDKVDADLRDLHGDCGRG